MDAEPIPRKKATMKDKRGREGDGHVPLQNCLTQRSPSLRFLREATRSFKNAKRMCELEASYPASSIGVHAL